jgi:D-hydroxyproline dehydrogenase subunit gamma
MAAREQQPNVETITASLNGRAIVAAAGTSVAAAIMMHGAPCRIGVSGEPRGPLCGMGICMECCATVDGVEHVRTCQTLLEEGMEIVIG